MTTMSKIVLEGLQQHGLYVKLKEGEFEVSLEFLGSFL